MFAGIIKDKILTSFNIGGYIRSSLKMTNGYRSHGGQSAVVMRVGGKNAGNPLWHGSGFVEMKTPDGGLVCQRILRLRGLAAANDGDRLAALLLAWRTLDALEGGRQWLAGSGDAMNDRAAGFRFYAMDVDQKMDGASL